MVPSIIGVKLLDSVFSFFPCHAVYVETLFTNAVTVDCGQLFDKPFPDRVAVSSLMTLSIELFSS